MKDYVIVTDSTADMPYEEMVRLEIEVVPMEFIMDGDTYHHYADAREMSYETFYDHIKAGKKISTTQINYFTYENVFRPILERGQDLLYIAFSSGLSGTYQAAKLVVEDLLEEFPERKILLVDSLSASIGEGLLVYLAGEKRRNQMSLEDLYIWVKENRLKVGHWFVVDDLNHLKQGGRINAIQATLGSALNLKPMLSVDDEGKLVSVSKIRGTKKIVEAFVARIKHDGIHTEEQTVIVGHASNLAMAEKIKDRLLELELVQKVLLADIGPIIGTHVGAGMAALVFMGNERNLEAI
ncbi:MAG TPA: DegV family protein [Candidatus Merdenecus merdavium]|nr:DegV family protein [Candidatus Merdenecus merdavium]